MSDAAAVAKHAIKAETRRRSPLASALPVTALVLIDVALSLLAFALSYKLRQHTDIFIWRPRKSFWPIGVAGEFEPYLGFLFFVPIVKTYMLRRYGLYRLRGEFSFGNDFAKITSASTLASLVLVLIAFSFRQGFAYREGHLVWLDFSYSRLVFVYDWLIAIAAFWIARSVVRVIQILYRSAERNLIPTVVVGCGEMAQVCISEIAKKRRLGYKLVGAVKARVNEDTSSLTSYGVRMLGGFDDLPDLVKRYGVEEVLITDTRINPRKMFEVLMECGRDHHIKYRVIPNLFDCLPGKFRNCREVLVLGALQILELLLEERDIALQFLNFLARRRSRHRHGQQQTHHHTESFHWTLLAVAGRNRSAPRRLLLYPTAPERSGCAGFSASRNRSVRCTAGALYRS